MKRKSTTKPSATRSERAKRKTAKLQATSPKQVKYSKTMAGDKILDAGSPVGGGKVEEWWGRRGVNTYFARLVNLKRVPKDHLSNGGDPNWLCRQYKLKGIEFGNWLSQDDRYNYLFSTMFGLHDMKLLLNLAYHQMGFAGKLSIALGARGSGSALAHFEPMNFAINITRYQEGIDMAKFFNNASEIPVGSKALGGIGSFSHEWGHALDLYAGYVLDRASGEAYLSGGHSTRTTTNLTILRNGGLKGLMEKIMMTLMWADGEAGTAKTKFYVKLKAASGGPYWRYRTEIFARTFESYLAMKLTRKGWKNEFISKPKYKSEYYPDNNLLRKVEPMIDQLVKSIMAKVR